MTARELRSVLVIAATYFYFLLFAQFAFLEGLLEGGVEEQGLKPVMGAMGIGGILGCIFVGRLARRFGGERMLRICFVLSGLSAGLSLVFSQSGLAMGLALLFGFALGVVTVLVAVLLPTWVSASRAGLVIGLGTGMAYALCNVPSLFRADWGAQSLIAMVAVLVAAGIVPKSAVEEGKRFEMRSVRGWSLAVVLTLTILVWFDSAAFFIIQHTEEMKKATWEGGQLWRNAGLHLAAAVISGVLLDRGRLWTVLILALLLLSLAGKMVNEAGMAVEAGWLYPVGVSLYSVALVMFSGYLSGARSQEARLRHAALVFGVAGWFGSAMGVGMAENLHVVPTLFVVMAWLLVGLSVIACSGWEVGRKISIGTLVVGVCVIGFLGNRGSAQPPRGASSVDRGRAVYVAEGCIHCHSRYVRPGTEDEEMWGPSKSLDVLLKEQSVLFGNRRQGPDLLQVGLRRSKRWLELHFREPGAFSPGTTMPSYAHLFEDRRGSDLVAYLTELDSNDLAARLETINQWRLENATGRNGAESYETHCAACHGVEGRGDGLLAAQFQRPPANLVAGPFPFSGAARVGESLLDGVARVVKFGVPGTDMSGHEWLADEEVAGLAARVLEFREEGGNE